jgi:NADP-dependent 3-hydroxy acid dehydrogenase YdfG
VDVLVNNAGRTISHGPIHEADFTSGGATSV